MSKTQKSIPAAVLKSIDDIAPTFDMPVTIQVRGQEHVINVQCKALPKLEWAEIRDKANEEARARSEQRIEAASEEGGEKIKIANVVRDGMSADSALVMEFAIGWDFSDPLSVESLIKLENKCGGAIGAIIGKYEVAIYQGRLGN